MDVTRIRLLDADADLGRYLTTEERVAAGALSVPCLQLEPGDVDVHRLVERTACFGAFVVDGMLAAHMRVGEQAGMRILGPGDVVSAAVAEPSMLLVDAGWRAVVPTRIALLGKDVLIGAHRWPRLIAGLHARTAEQIERVAVQLAICQLPRVEDRLLALFWLLAESWGRVTPAGTALPLALTHETLGALVGARRPTVTLALGELSERGAVLRQGRTWLLVERLTPPTREVDVPHAPSLVADGHSVWTEAEPLPFAAPSHAAMAATLDRLRRQHQVNEDLVRDGLARVRAARDRSIELRASAAATRLGIRTRGAPSSG
jgi:CRP/FNR family transcriptional regulator, cyclic AMP receptor protein